MRIEYSCDVDIDVVAAPEIQNLCSVSEGCVMVVLMINKTSAIYRQRSYCLPKINFIPQKLCLSREQDSLQNPADAQVIHVVILI